LSLPVGPTRGLVGLVEKGSNAIGIKPPVSKAMIDKYTEDIAVDGSLIQKKPGFVPQYDLKTGWEETIKEMRQENSFTF
jgi:hypothetical protein